MNFDYIDLFFINLFPFITSIALFLGTLRFGDSIIDFFR